MRHWYLTFPQGISPKDALYWIKQWGASIDSHGPALERTSTPDSDLSSLGMVLENQLSVPVLASMELQERVKELPGTRLHDNEFHQDLYNS